MQSQNELGDLWQICEQRVVETVHTTGIYVGLNKQTVGTHRQIYGPDASGGNTS